jgi:dolichol-phosphate mannosyltransferase
MIVELSVIIPTFNERENINPLIDALDNALFQVKWEAIFVDDDSDDGTAESLCKIGQNDPRIRCLRRIGRRGLSSACLEGMGASNAPFLAVIDADMQHDETLLPRMLEILKSGSIDLVVGSRYIAGGSTDLWSRKRLFLSRVATRLGQVLLRTPLSDPMSGFFMISRDLLDRAVHRMSGKGFKTLLDLVTSVDGAVRYEEVPYVFRNRRFGETKLDVLVVGEYLLLLYDKFFGHVVPARFLMFVTVGIFGALLHLAILGTLLKYAGIVFYIGQTVAAVVAMAFNFFANNLFTHRDKRLKGVAFAKGLAGFLTVCAIGAFVNVRIADFLFEHSIPWWVAGLLGAIVGSVWNYSVSSSLVWKRYV